MGNFVLYRNGKRTDITGSIEKIRRSEINLFFILFVLVIVIYLFFIFE